MSRYIVEYYITVEHNGPTNATSEIPLSNGTLLQPGMHTLANYIEVSAESPQDAVAQTQSKVIGTESALREQPGWYVQDGAVWQAYEVMNQDTGEVMSA